MTIAQCYPTNVHPFDSWAPVQGGLTGGRWLSSEAIGAIPHTPAPLVLWADPLDGRRRGPVPEPTTPPVAARGGEPSPVSEVKVREGETFESALRRFNKKIKQNGILSEVRRREHYEKPSVRRKRKLVAARKRRAKAG